MKKLLFALLFVGGYLYSQSHFTSVEPTGLPYTVVIEDVFINGLEIARGSEIAVFDDSLCVGTGLYDDSTSVPITCWRGSPNYGLAGFTEGDTMIFKVWTFWAGDSVELNMYPEFLQGNGVFGWGTYSLVNLKKTLTTVKSSAEPEKSVNLGVYPNPANGLVNISLTGLKRNRRASLSIFSATGELVYRFGNLISDDSKVFLQWRGTNIKGRTVASGCYFIDYRDQNYTISKPIIYLK